MKPKHSAILLSGLLLLGLSAAVSQTSETKPPTCPAVSDAFEQSLLEPTAWIKADWNKNTRQWEIRCNEIDSLANLPAYQPGGPKSNVNAANTAGNRPRRRRGSE